MTSAGRDQRIVLVDPISSGTPMREVARRCGFRVAAVYTLAPDLLTRLGYSAEQLERNADEVFMSDDLEACADRFEGAVGVIPCSEPGVVLASRLAAALGLPGNDPAGILAARDKCEMRKVVSDAGLRCPKFATCHGFVDALTFAATHGYPCIVKTPRGAGGSNVRRCENLDELRAAFHLVTSKADVFGNVASTALIEELLVGEEVAVNLFFDGKKGHPVDAIRYEKGDTRFGRMLYRAARFDSSWPPALRDAAEYAIQVCEAMQLVRGAVHVELMLSARGPVLVELGARFAGGGCSEICAEYSDFPIYEKQLEVFTRGVCDVSLPARYHRRAALAFCPSVASGQVQRIRGIDQITALPSYRAHNIAVAIGDQVSPTVDLNNTPLAVRLAHEDALQIERDIAAVHASFRIDTTRDSLGTGTTSGGFGSGCWVMKVEPGK